MERPEEGKVAMRIGIDARSQARRLAGIGYYLQEMLKRFLEAEDENEYYLYSNQDFELPFNTMGRVRKRIYEGKGIGKKVGNVYVRKVVLQLLAQDGINVFWGPEHCLPKPVSGVRYVVTIHDLAAILYPGTASFYNGMIQKWVCRTSCSYADKIIAISENTKKDILEVLSIGEDRIEVIYNGYSPYKRQDSRIEMRDGREIRSRFRIEDKFVLFMGTIEPRKNLVTLIEGFERWQLKEEGTCQLVLAGGLGWKYRKILKKIEGSAVREKIILAGYVSDLEKEWLYRNADVLAFPSLYEGFGLPIVEAMSVGTPVITSAVSSMPEAGGAAAFYLQDSSDAEEMAGLLSRVFGLDACEKEECIQRGYAQAERFSGKMCAAKTLELFRALGKERREL